MVKLAPKLAKIDENDGIQRAHSALKYSSPVEPTWVFRVVLSWYTFTLGKNSQLVRNHSWKILPTAIFYQLPFLTNWAGKYIYYSVYSYLFTGRSDILQ